MNYHVAIMGASLSTANRGVSALGASLVRLAWHSQPDAAISLLVGNRDATRTDVRVDGAVRSVGTVNFRMSPLAPLGQQLWWIVLMSLACRALPWAAARKRVARTSPWIRAALEADFVGDIRGGDSFSDIYGVAGFLVGCLPVLSVIWIRGGIHLLPQTYGPFRSSLAERAARYILLRAHTIWCRDRVSLQEVSRLTAGRRKGELCPDVAFELEAVRPGHPVCDPPVPQDNRGTLIGLNVSGLMYHGGFTRANMFGLKLDYRGFLVRLVEQLLAGDGHRVMLVPHTFAASGRVESDPDACRDLLERVPPQLRERVHLVTREYDQHEIKGVIGLCDFFIGSRMHACIAALSQGIPTIGVAYSRKFAGVFEIVGAAEWVIDGRTATIDEALSRTAGIFSMRQANKPALEARVAAAKGELIQVFHRVLAAPVPGASMPAETHESGL
jgi:polysaccharide pyruvyl transferase WcaK-like protein